MIIKNLTTNKIKSLLKQGYVIIAEDGFYPLVKGNKTASIDIGVDNFNALSKHIKVKQVIYKWREK